MKFVEFLSKFAIIAFFLVSLFYLFVFPFLVASKHLGPSILTIFLGVLVYCQLLILTLEFLYTTFAGLYNFKKKELSLLKKIVGDDRRREPKVISKIEVLGSVIISYFFIVYCFAIAYLFIGNFITNSFDKTEISFIDTFFLSFTSISVGPSGIQPTSLLTKSLVMFEISIGLIYGVLVFSLIASSILKKTDQDKIN